MGRSSLGTPGEFAKRVSSEMRRELGDRRISGRSIARLMSKSEKYVRTRLNDEAEFTIGDLETFCRVLEIDVVEFVDRAERSAGHSSTHAVKAASARNADGTIQTRVRATTTSSEPTSPHGDLMGHLG